MNIRSRMKKNTIRSVGLLALWIGGLSLGLLAARFYGDAWTSFLRPLTGMVPEVGGVFATAVFPLLLSAWAVMTMGEVGCFLVVACRGCFLGFFLGILALAYGAMGWVLALGLGFSRIASGAVTLFYGLRYLSRGPGVLGSSTLACVVCCVAIGWLDRVAVAPYLAEHWIL